jgi:hypothetical protein
MHHRAKDLTGLTVGYLTVTQYQGSNGKKSLWAARCSCGRTVVLPGTELVKQEKRGIEASCGCMRRATIGRKRTTHGMSKHPAFAVWRSMLDRCRLPSHAAWKNYGARGITVCDSWRGSFAAFWADMGPTYRQGLTLERENNTLGYSPENCAWRTPKVQANNTRRSHWLDTPAGRMTAAQAAEHYRVKYTTLLYRLSAGWPINRALSTTSSTAAPVEGSLSSTPPVG